MLLAVFVAARSWAQDAPDAGEPVLAANAEEVDAGPVEATDAGEVATGATAELEGEPDEDGLAAALADPVQSIAANTAQAASDAPATSWLISGADLRRLGIQSVEEAVRYLGHAMSSYEFNAKAGAAFTSRGYSSDQLGLHMAVFVDGNQTDGSALTTQGASVYLMPIELIDHIEVLIGPGSVLYGNHAMLGVINVVLRGADSLKGVHATVQVGGAPPVDPGAKDLSWGEVNARAAVYGGASGTLLGKSAELTWHLGLRYDRMLGYRVWDRRTGLYDDQFGRDALGRLTLRARWGDWHFLGWAGVRQGWGSTATGGTSNSGSFEPEYGLDASRHWAVRERGDFMFRAYVTVFDTHSWSETYSPHPDECRQAVGDAACYDTLDWLTVKPHLESMFTWDWGLDRRHVTTVGAHLLADISLVSTGYRSFDGQRAQSPAPDVAPLPNAALYAQHVWRFSAGSLYVGLRGDVGALDWNLAPRVSLNLSPAEHLNVKAIFSSAFRTPTITERFLEVPHVLLANPDLVPENVYSAELAAQYQVGGQTLLLSLYADYWRNVIRVVAQTVNGELVNQFRNVSTVVSAGVNAAWKGRQGPFDWALSLSYAPGRYLLNPAELATLKVLQSSLDTLGRPAFGETLLPVEGGSDFYATAHATWAVTGWLAVTVAANVNSPRLRYYALTAQPVADLGAWLPWSLDTRTAVEVQASKHVQLRLIYTGRTFTTGPTFPPQLLDNFELPQPNGTLGLHLNPVPNHALMAEVSVHL
ncbi:MAG: TonB-dependent receptor [Archangiaceae bacterium]|nr:TonB-dependent receptor [Archangiaceae bacterium]